MIDKLIPRYLETSKDNRSKGSNELIDALNITVTGDSDGGQGVVKNIKGTTPIIQSLPENVPPAGVNTCIGSVRDEGLGVVYFFVHNNEGNHGVYAYSAKTDTYRLIFMDESLDFQENGFVKADVIRIKRREKDKEFIPFIPEDTTGFEEEVIFDPCSIDAWFGPQNIIESFLITANQEFLPFGVSVEEAIELYAGVVCGVPPPPPPPPLAFTGDFCDYPLLIDSNFEVTQASITVAFADVFSQVSNNEITETEATYLFPNFGGVSNPETINPDDLDDALEFLEENGPVTCGIPQGDTDEEDDAGGEGA